MLNTPVPTNEMDRLMDLSEFDIDYSSQQDNFKDLAKLAAKVAGTKISLVNLIDTFTQWTISNHGLDIDQMDRTDSVCQYTIVDGDHFEVEDLKNDERFKDKFYVVDEPNLRYYFGVPLKNEGHNLGALCVLDKDLHTLSPEKIELLKIIADEIVNRLKAFKAINNLKSKLHEANESQKKVAHDIRGPLGGIIGLAQIISEQGHENKLDEVLEFINLIHKSGNSILELADEILSADKPKALKSDELNVMMLKDKLDKLYAPQARNKHISFVINIDPETATTPFSKNKLLQIVGNLVSNAMKFTPAGGKITVDLNMLLGDVQNILQIKVSDMGVGMDKVAVDAIISGTASSTNGTGGEQGYGFGLALVKHLIESLRGSLQIHSSPGNGATFEVNLPQDK